MVRKVLLLLVAVLALVACESEPDVVITDEEADVEETVEVPETPLEAVDECAEVSAAEGAPAGVTMMDSFFEPNCVAVSSTQPITLTNAGNIDHTFTVADGDIDIVVEPGEDATTDETGTDLSAGTYRFFCRFHEAQGMVGTLVVE